WFAVSCLTGRGVSCRRFGGLENPPSLTLVARFLYLLTRTGGVTPTLREPKQIGVASGRSDTQFAVGRGQRYAALRCAFHVALHDQIRLVDISESPRFLAHRHGQRIQSHRTAGELVDQRFEDAL